MTETVLFPHGDGDTGCDVCLGRGVIRIPKAGPPTVQRCRCVLVKQTLANLERAWRGLSKAKPIPDSPLKKRIDKNIWITASDRSLKRHLKHVGSRMVPDWRFKVVTDKELITAWLGSIALKGGEILGPDAISVSTRYITIEDLVEPPDLVVLRLGVKAAANREMPQVLFEALSHRIHLSKPTWVVDQPTYPFGRGHLCWSETAEDEMETWARYHIDKTKGQMKSPQRDLPEDVTPVGGSDAGTTRNCLDEIFDNEKETKKKGKGKPYKGGKR
mgnify:FL=1